MNMSNIARTARLYLRAEMMVAQIRMRSEGRRMALVGLALFLVVLGFGLLNIAFYAAIVSVWGPVWTPLALGLIDMAVAAIALIAAAMQKPGPELEVAEEMRTLAGTALEEQFHSGVSVGGLAGNLVGGDATAARLLIPVITTIVGALRRRKDSAKS